MSTKPVLTLEELQALAAAGAGAGTWPRTWAWPEAWSGVGAGAAVSPFWFYIRTAFCIAFVMANVLSLTLFFEHVFGKFDLPPATMAMLSSYVGLRLVMAVLLVPLYALSYIKRVYFVQLSLAYVVIMAVNIINDFLLIFVHARPDALPSVIIMIGLRLAVMIMILMNARYSLNAGR